MTVPGYRTIGSLWFFGGCGPGSMVSGPTIAGGLPSSSSAQVNPTQQIARAQALNVAVAQAQATAPRPSTSAGSSAMVMPAPKMAPTQLLRAGGGLGPRQVSGALVSAQALRAPAVMARDPRAYAGEMSGLGALDASSLSGLLPILAIGGLAYYLLSGKKSTPSVPARRRTITESY